MRVMPFSNTFSFQQCYRLVWALPAVDDTEAQGLDINSHMNLVLFSQLLKTMLWTKGTQPASVRLLGSIYS